MDYEKYSEKEVQKGHVLIPALVGTSMALIIVGMTVDSFGYTFRTIAPSVLLVACLWWPYVGAKILEQK